jgi:hypothetical protein
MGYNENGFNEMGAMFINTNGMSPFCGYHALFEFNVNEQSKSTTGDISIKINSDPNNLIKVFKY